MEGNNLIIDSFFLGQPSGNIILPEGEQLSISPVAQHSIGTVGRWLKELF